MKMDTLENRMRIAHLKAQITPEKQLMGSTKGKFPVVLDDGKTIVYISDESKEAETRLKYKLLRESRFPSHSGNYRS